MKAVYDFSIYTNGLLKDYMGYMPGYILVNKGSL